MEGRDTACLFPGKNTLDMCIPAYMHADTHTHTHGFYFFTIPCVKLTYCVDAAEGINYYLDLQPQMVSMRIFTVTVWRERKRRKKEIQLVLHYIPLRSWTVQPLQPSPYVAFLSDVINICR